MDAKEEKSEEFKPKISTGPSSHMGKDEKRRPKSSTTPEEKKKNNIAGARPKTSSDKKKRTLAEAKKIGRKMRSDNKPVQILGQFQSLSLDSRLNLPSRTCLAFDEKMTKYFCLWDEHYAENPARLTKTWERCCLYKLPERCLRVQPKVEVEEDILTVHGQEYYDLVENSTNMTEAQLADLSSRYDSIYFHPDIHTAALTAVGCTLQVIEDVVAGKAKNGMALVRPPGHHAMENRANGFCLFNNVAIGARHASRKLGVQRILIVDWDVHHGQSTQYTFYDDPNVLYFSIHRYQRGAFWPNLRESNYDYIGEGRGKGFNINVSLNEVGLGNEDYLAIFQQVLLPIAYQFNPELVLLSAGYDGAVGDLKGEMKVTPAFYSHMTHALMGLADGKVCVVLEGGYCLRSLAEGTALTLRTLLGDPCPMVGSLGQPHESTVNSILNCIKVLRPYWKCLRYQGQLEPGLSCEVDDIIYDESFAREKPEKYEISNCYPTLTSEAAMFVDWQLDQLIAETNLNVAPNRTCFVYDEAMRKHHNAVYSGHPERPDRISRIFALHKEHNLLNRVVSLTSRVITKDELELVHSLDYIEEIEAMKNIKPRELIHLEDRYNSVYLSQDVYDCACLAAGSLLNVVDHVMSGQSTNGVAVIRPPGHHAEPTTAGGFCFFNSVAIAAKYSQKKFNLKRVLILDWDIHHGNGTQLVFEEDPSVLYISIHRYDNGFFFPGSTDANYDAVGKNQGRGFTVNIPWNKRGVGDAEYLAAFQQVVMPIAYEFNPELVLVSAGFDAARGDVLGGCNVTPEGYAHMTHMLSSLAGGKVILALEGGYNLTSISESMAMCTSILLGDPCPPLALEHRPTSLAVESICHTLDEHSKFWKCLCYRVDLPVVAKYRVYKPGSGEDSITDDTSIEGDSISTDKSSTDNEFSQMESLISGVQNISVDDSLCIHGNPMFGEQSKSLNTSDIVKVSAPGDDDEEEALSGAVGGSNVVNGEKTLAELFGGLSCDQDAQMFAVVPLSWCPHLSEVQNLPTAGLNVYDPCADCGAVGENWVCLTCYQVYCSRYVNEHMVIHGVTSEHPVVLSYADLSVWCYVCDNYIDNMILQPAKEAAHLSKFGS